MPTLTLKKTLPSELSISLPLSKSMQVRAMMIAAVSGGVCRLSAAPESDDALHMQRCLSELQSGATIINVCDAGTVMRFLTAYVASTRGLSTVITGVERMKNRPIAPLVDALRFLGAEIEYLEKEGYPPLQINGRALNGGEIVVDARLSSQYISALMLIAPSLNTKLSIRWNHKPTSFAYIQLSADMLKHAGVAIEQRDNGIDISQAIWQGVEIECEPDWSAASFWYAAVAIIPQLQVKMPHFIEKSLQPDRQTQHIFTPLGVETTFSDGGIILNASNRRDDKIVLDMSSNPDLVLPLVVAACCVGTQFLLRNINSLRVKECDRVCAIVDEMRKSGFVIRQSQEENSIEWTGEYCEQTQETLKTYGDHRMAMSLSLLALTGRKIMLDDISVVKKSYPSFWKHMGHLLGDFHKL